MNTKKSTWHTLATGLLLLGLVACDRSNPLTPDAATVSDARGVVNEIFGMPLAGVRVEATDGPAAGQFVVTDDAGRFLLSGARGRNGVSLQMTRDGFAAKVVPFYPATAARTMLWPLARQSPDDGPYALTLTADPACTALPAELRTRTYAGSIERTGDVGPFGEAFTVALGGAEFFPNQRVMYGSTGVSGFSLSVFSWEFFVTWLEDGPIVEKVGPESYLSVKGTARGMGMSETAGVTIALDGTVSYCPRDAGNPLYSACVVPPIDCQSTGHRLTVSLR